MGWWSWIWILKNKDFWSNSRNPETRVLFSMGYFQLWYVIYNPHNSTCIMVIYVRRWMKKWRLMVKQMQALLEPEQFWTSKLICIPLLTAYSSGQRRGFPANVRNHTGPDLGDSMLLLLLFMLKFTSQFTSHLQDPSLYAIAEVGVPQFFPNWWNQETPYSPNATRQLQKNFKLLASPSWRRRWIPKLYVSKCRIDLSEHIFHNSINLQCLHQRKWV